jgi:predicted N-acyltransferase
MSSLTLPSISPPDSKTHRDADVWSEGIFQVYVQRDINAISASEWDRLLGPDDLQTSHRFVRLCQEACTWADFWHLLIYEQGRLCGVGTISRMEVHLDLLTTGVSRALLQLPRRVWPKFLCVPVLFGGLPVSFGQPCLKLAPRCHSHALGLIARTMERIGAATSTSLMCFKEFDPAATAKMQPLEDMGFLRAFSLPSSELSLQWNSFSGYLGAMTAGYRRQARATLRAGQAASLRVRHVERFSREGDVIFALYQQVIERARHRLETLERPFIDRLDADLGEQSRAIFLERGGQALAVAILLFNENVATFLLAGLDYAAPREWQVYANLALEVVAEAIRAGATRLQMGQTCNALKSRLGAVESPRFLYLRHCHPLTDWLLRRASPFLFPKQDYPPRRVFRESTRP